MSSRGVYGVVRLTPPTPQKNQQYSMFAVSSILKLQQQDNR